MRNRNAFFAGLFIVVSVLAICAIVVGLKGTRAIFEPMQHASISFKLTDDIGGLQAGDEVRIGGAKVGRVQSVEILTATTQPSIKVSFSLPRQFVLHEDADIGIQSTVTGVSVLNFSDLGSGAVLADGQSLVGKPSSLATLLGVGKDLSTMIRDVRDVTLPKVNQTVDATHAAVDTYHTAGDQATGLITDARAKIEPITQKYFTVSDAAKVALDAVGSLFGDTKTDFRTSVANVRELTGSLKDKVPPLVDHLDTVLTKTSGTIDDTRTALQDVQKVAANTSAISQHVRQIIADNRGKIESIIAALKVSGDNVKGATAEVRRSPWRLLYKPAPGEMSNLNLYDSARQFSEGAAQLNDAATSLRDLASDPKADPEAVKKLLQKLDQQFASFDQVEQNLWKQVQK